MKLFEIANKYCKESDWKTLTLLKFCLFSIGIIVGILIPKTATNYILIVFGIIFIITYIPLMIKFFKLIKEENNR